MVEKGGAASLLGGSSTPGCGCGVQSGKGIGSEQEGLGLGLGEKVRKKQQRQVVDKLRVWSMGLASTGKRLWNVFEEGRVLAKPWFRTTVSSRVGTMWWPGEEGGGGESVSGVGDVEKAVKIMGDGGNPRGPLAQAPGEGGRNRGLEREVGFEPA